MEKYDLLPKQLIHEGTCNKSDFFSPSPAPDQEVKAIHGPEYVDRLKAMNLSTSEIRKIGFPISSQLLERELVIAGGTIEGCLKAYDTEIAFNIAGGTHHAYRDHGEAFCLLNDQAIAAQFLLDQKLPKKYSLLI
jgi:acetoin utilization deacetylase AcuC-like enzyme